MNCRNCGVPLHGAKCEYCGSIDLKFGEELNRLKSQRDELLRQIQNQAVFSRMEKSFCGAMSSATTFIFPPIN